METLVEALIFVVPSMFLLLRGTSLLLAINLLHRPNSSIARKLNADSVRWRLASILRTCGWLVLVLAAALELTYIGVGINGLITNDYLVGEWASIPFVLVICILGMLLSLKEIEIARALDGLNWQERRYSRRTVILLELAAIIQIALPVLMLLSYVMFLIEQVGWLSGLVAVVTVICLPLTMWLLSAGSNRARQGDLLWTIAIALDQKAPLADEIERYANLDAKKVKSFRLPGEIRPNSRYGLQVRQLAQHLRDGLELSDALEKVPDVVPKHTIVAARVGENSGDLAGAIRDSALHHTSELSDSGSNLSLTLFATYHVLMILLMQLVAAFLLVFIVPKFKHIFDDMGVQLPPLSVALIEVADLLVQHFYISVPLLVGIPVWCMIFSVEGYRRGWENMRLGWLTRWYVRFDTPGILRHLHHAIACGKPVGDALGAIVFYHHRTHIRETMERILVGVRNGNNCWQLMRDEGFLTRNEQALFDSAQRAGNLPWSLQSVATRITRQQQDFWQRCFELLRPVIVIMLGVIVAWICYAMFMPLMALIADSTRTV